MPLRLSKCLKQCLSTLFSAARNTTAERFLSRARKRSYAEHDINVAIPFACLSECLLSIYPTETLQYCVKTNKHVFKMLSLTGNSTALVFRYFQNRTS